MSDADRWNACYACVRMSCWSLTACSCVCHASHWPVQVPNDVEQYRVVCAERDQLRAEVDRLRAETNNLRTELEQAQPYKVEVERLRAALNVVMGTTERERLERMAEDLAAERARRVAAERVLATLELCTIEIPTVEIGQCLADAKAAYDATKPPGEGA